MKKNRFLILIIAVMLIGSISSCGIFNKGCGCPHFGVIKTPTAHLSKVNIIA